MSWSVFGKAFLCETVYAIPFFIFLFSFSASFLCFTGFLIILCFPCSSEGQPLPR